MMRENAPPINLVGDAQCSGHIQKARKFMERPKGCDPGRVSSIKLARHVAEPELSMDLLVASAVLEFADDLRAAGEAATEWDTQPR
jgi:hypothetical protein